MTRTILFALCAAAVMAAAPASARQTVTTTAVPPAEDSVLGGTEYTKLPESWELAYDVAMQPYIDDYKKCLGYGNLVFDGSANVEQQHRADIPRCASVMTKAIEQSNAVLARRNRSDAMPPAKVAEAFAVLGYIHIQRGRNFDDQLKLQQRAVEERQRLYEAQIAARDAALAAQRAAQPSDTEARTAPQTVEAPHAEN